MSSTVRRASSSTRQVTESGGGATDLARPRSVPRNLPYIVIIHI